MKTLETKRLILRDWKETDLDNFHDYAKVEGVGERAGWPHHTTIEITKNILDDFIQQGDVYAIVLKENNKVIGSLGVHNKTMDKNYQAAIQREIGYVLSKDYWGLGLMVEAVKAAISYAFDDLNVDVVWCGHFNINNQSQRVVQKCSFKFYGNGTYESPLLNTTFEGKKYLLTKDDYLDMNF